MTRASPDRGPDADEPAPDPFEDQDPGGDAEEAWVDSPSSPPTLDAWPPESTDADEIWPEIPERLEAVDTWPAETSAPEEDWTVAPFAEDEVPTGLVYTSQDDEPTHPLRAIPRRQAWKAIVVSPWERVSIPELGLQDIDAVCEPAQPRTRLRAHWTVPARGEEGEPEDDGFLHVEVAGHVIAVPVETDDDGNPLVHTDLLLAGVRVPVVLYLEDASQGVPLVIGGDVLSRGFLVDAALSHATQA